ncbi:hypothetical protein LptCag_1579 [Leptospirillum ferriphilum]|uniref:Uncharacterized protein n=1 Tax=Leptospirillum ferriphilum TaxID=178606 RepID=A0A094X5P7_9BACT|nr:hypothetical protein LptCag_1579 [Leptospirillum ferriphilum]
MFLIDTPVSPVSVVGSPPGRSPTVTAIASPIVNPTTLALCFSSIHALSFR